MKYPDSMMKHVYLIIITLCLNFSVHAQVKKDYGEGFLEEGATSNLENWNLWYIDNGNLVGLFTVYQVTAYANGEPELSVPLVELKDIERQELSK